MELLFALLGALVALIIGFGLGWWLSGLRDPRLRLARLLVSVALAVSVCRIPDIEFALGGGESFVRASLRSGLDFWSGLIICLAIVMSVIVFRSSSNTGLGQSNVTNVLMERVTIRTALQFIEGRASELPKVQKQFLTEYLLTDGSAQAVEQAKKASLTDTAIALAWIRARLKEAQTELRNRSTEANEVIDHLDGILAKLAGQLPIDGGG